MNYFLESEDYQLIEAICNEVALTGQLPCLGHREDEEQKEYILSPLEGIRGKSSGLQ